MIFVISKLAPSEMERVLAQVRQQVANLQQPAAPQLHRPPFRKAVTRVMYEAHGNCTTRSLTSEDAPSTP